MKTSAISLLLTTLLFQAVTSSPTPVDLHKRSFDLLPRQANGSNSTTPAAPAPAGSETYIIKAGDTLASIATATNRGICDIAAANKIVDPDFIQAGMTLIIPPAAPTKDDTSCLGGAKGGQGSQPTSAGDPAGEPAAKPTPAADPATEGEKPGEPGTEGQKPTSSTPEPTPAAGGENPDASPKATPAAEAGEAGMDE